MFISPSLATATHFPAMYVNRQLRSIKSRAIIYRT